MASRSTAFCLPGPVMTGRRRSYLAHWAPLHNKTIEEATAKFPQEAGIARYGEPEEIAELMAFLVSPGARWMTGSTLRMDGGEVKSGLRGLRRNSQFNRRSYRKKLHEKEGQARYQRPDVAALLILAVQRYAGQFGQPLRSFRIQDAGLRGNAKGETRLDRHFGLAGTDSVPAAIGITNRFRSTTAVGSDPGGGLFEFVPEAIVGDTGQIRGA